ncbi:hypothetical protein BGM09_23970 [Streptomyces sp. CBMA29]|nr:hypothetical protein [Streptomyces sp. CBMA29]
MLKEHVFIPDEKYKDTFIKGYREHLKSCGAQVVSSQNGEATEFALPGTPKISIGFEDGRVTALQGYGKNWDSSNLTALLEVAQEHSSKLSLG